MTLDENGCVPAIDENGTTPCPFGCGERIQVDVEVTHKCPAAYKWLNAGYHVMVYGINEG